MQNLAKAMAGAFPEIEGALKNKVNPHLRNNYADLGSVIDAVKPALEKHGLWFTQISHNIEGAAAVETVIVHSSGETFSTGIVAVPVVKTDAQGFGSAMSYARRYSLSAAFGVKTADDDGHAAARSAPKAAPKPAAKVAKYQETIAGMANREQITAWFKTVPANDREILVPMIQARLGELNA